VPPCDDIVLPQFAGNDFDFLFGGGVIDDQQLFGQPLAKSAVRPDDKVNRHDGRGRLTAIRPWADPA
jgi:hypothetical protein